MRASMKWTTRLLSLLLLILSLAVLAACKEEEVPLETSEGATPGLAYELNEGETAYTVTGMGTADATSIVIPEIYLGLPVEAIGDAAFRTCTELVEVDLPNSVKKIGSRAFWDCVALKTFTVKQGSELTEIGYGAFNGCVELLRFTIYEDSKITAIGKSAFTGCTKLTGFSFPKGITAIEPYTFKGCSKLARITVPAAVTTIGDYAFEHCAALTNLNFENNSVLTTIGMSAFEYCTALESVDLPSTVQTLAASSFRHCTKLLEFTVPAATTNIGTYALAGTPKLLTLNVAAGNTKYVGINNCVIEINTKTLVAGCRKSVIPSDGAVKIIGTAAFAECAWLTAIQIPNGVEKICSFAFYDCNRLQSVDLAVSVKTVENAAFSFCNAMKSVYYHGDNTQRLAISVGVGNDGLYREVEDYADGVHWYYFSAATPETTNTHWRYVNNKPKIWVLS